MKILHLSDLHFGPFFETRVGEAAIAFAKKSAPTITVISGDFTQRAKREQFEQARVFIARLKELCPNVIVTPGNHDIPLYRMPERILAPFALYRELIHPQLDHFQLLPGCAIASLNSVRPYSRLTGGRLAMRQLEACRAFFAQAPDDALKVLTFHHHIYPIPSFAPQQALPNARDILDALTEMKLDLVLTGHIHRSYIGDSLDVYAGKERHRGVLIVSCGTTTSRRGRGPEREKNSLNLIVREAGALRIEHFMFFGEEGAFLPLSEHIFLRHGEPGRTVPIASGDAASAHSARAASARAAPLSAK